MKKAAYYLRFLLFYLKGVVRFRSKEYNSAKLNFEKAIRFNQKESNELLYQYFGQTLLSLGQTNEAFIYLANSYKIYENKGWKVSNEEEYRLAINTIDGLKYLDDNFNLRIENVDYKKNIIIEPKEWVRGTPFIFLYLHLGG